MPNERETFRRVELWLPTELREAIQAIAGPGGVNAWCNIHLAKAAGLKLPADRLSPPRGYPKGQPRKPLPATSPKRRRK